MTAKMTEETADERMTRLITDKMVKPLRKRFYKTVSIATDNAILLDGRGVKTPLKAKLMLPNAAMAEAVAEEWRVQTTAIDPALMPLTKLANTAIDRATTERQMVVDEIVNYAGTDLVCYRAAEPETLVARQYAHWQPVLDWAAKDIAAAFKTATGISHVAQAAHAVSRLRAHVEKFDAWQLTGAYLLTTLSGSALLALMLQAGAISADAAWVAANVDEDFQIEKWGEDWEATQRRQSRKNEFDGLVKYFDLLR